MSFGRRKRLSIRKISERERIERFNAWDAFSAAAAGVAPKFQQELPPEPKRRKPRQDSGVDIDAVHRKRAAPLESEVVRAVGELLSKHHLVLFAVRQNSGAASYEAKSGKWAPVHFYKIVTGQPVRISDFWGIMRDGRMLALECKRPGWTKPTDQREHEQAAFLMLVRNCGGIGAFVTSADDALRHLT